MPSYWDATKQGTGTVKTVNHVQPDSDGNVDVVVPTPPPATGGGVTEDELAAEAAARDAADTAEAAARAAADSAETASRVSGDTANASALTAEATARASGDSTNAAAIAAEATARASAVTTEATTRAAADSTNATAISSEAATRASQDAVLVAAIAARAYELVPTGYKTANYTAAASDLVLCNASAGTFAVTLPSAPPDGTKIGVLIGNITAGYQVNVNVGAGDAFVDATSTRALLMLRQSLIVTYQHATNLWWAESGLDVGQLDSRYLASGAARIYETTGAADLGDGTSTSFTVTHNLGRTYPSSVTVWNKTTGYRVAVDVTPIDANSLTVGAFGVAPTANSIRVEVVA